MKCVLFNSRRFGTLCLFHPYRRVDIKMEQVQCSETSAIKRHRPKKPKDYTQYQCRLLVISTLSNVHGTDIKVYFYILSF
jgi:hypothetical protein